MTCTIILKLLALFSKLFFIAMGIFCYGTNANSSVYHASHANELFEMKIIHVLVIMTLLGEPNGFFLSAITCKTHLYNYMNLQFLILLSLRDFLAVI